METNSGPRDHMSFFNDQVVFLTGATGGLGGCLLFKLASQLPTKKVYVLCRSTSKARMTWNKTMPNQIGSVLHSGKVKLVVGDILKPNFGIAPDLLAEIAAQTTIIIHSVRTHPHLCLRHGTCKRRYMRITLTVSPRLRIPRFLSLFDRRSTTTVCRH